MFSESFTKFAFGFSNVLCNSNVKLAKSVEVSALLFPRCMKIARREPNTMFLLPFEQESLTFVHYGAKPDFVTRKGEQKNGSAT